MLAGDTGFAALVNLNVAQLMAAHDVQVEQAAAIAVRLHGGVDQVQRLDWAMCGHTAFAAAAHTLDHPHFCPRCDGRRHTGCTVLYTPVGVII